jgi:hypothetical protein
MAAWSVPWMFVMGALILIGDQTRVRLDDVSEMEMMERSEKKLRKQDRDAAIKANTTVAW